MVLVSGPLDAAAVAEASARLMLLDATGDEPIALHLSCPDGDLDAALALADTIDLLGVGLTAWARGRVGGAAVAPYVAADRRVALPHTVFQLSEPSAEFSGSTDHLTTLADALTARLESFRDRVSTATGRPPGQIADDLRTGRVLSADEAVAYGLAHQVASAAHGTGSTGTGGTDA
jgi:ATP-dependent Clp protease protease subunit